MRRLLLLSIAAILAAATGCAAGGAGPTSNDRVQIFSAVLRRYLTNPAENSFPDRFENIYVLAHTNGRAGDPIGSAAGAGTAISEEDQQAIVEELRDLGSITFVDSDDEVIQTVDGCAQVRDGGILVTLGDPVGDALRVEVAVNGFVACLGATWLTYVVEGDLGDWRVTGTTGSIAVA